MTDILSLIFSQQFLLRALVVGLLISVCCALLGVSLVLKRFSMIGDGLSHVGFGAMAIACAANLTPLYFSVPIVLIAAFLLLRMNEKGKIKGDAAIALISTGALAVGVMVTSMTTGMNVDIYNYMFGSILTMTNTDVVMTSIISVVIILLFVLFYHEIFAVTFDESFARATGTRVSLYNMLIAGLTALTIVIGMRMMGALLISSLIIFPSVTSMRLCKSFRGVVISSAAVSVTCFLIGLLFSVKYEAPTGASVVCVNIYALAFFSALRLIKLKVKNDDLRKTALGVTSILFVFVAVFSLSFSSVNYKKTDKLSVVTTGFAQYDFAREIVRQEGDVQMLLSPGEESHTYEPTPADIMTIENCDIFIYGGGESETWVDNILESIQSDIIVIKMMDITSVCEVEHEHDHEKADDEHDHEEAEYDEHVWTSPVKAKEITTAVYEAVINKDKAHSDYYEANYNSFVRQLDELNERFTLLGQSGNNKTVVIGDRFPLRYLMLEYGFDYVSAFPGCSAQTEVNPVTIAEINEKIKAEGISTVFTVDLSTGNVARSISEETGATVDRLYSCHVVSADDYENGEGYISLMNRNYEAIKKAVS